LNRAFIYTGTTIIASLWSVREQPTSELMIAFFKSLKNGMSKIVALQAAQAQTRIKYPEPYWATFVFTKRKLRPLGVVAESKTRGFQRGGSASPLVVVV